MLDVRRRVWHRGDRGNRYQAPIITVSSFSVSHPLLLFLFPLRSLSLSTIRKKRRRERKISGIDISEGFFFFLLSFRGSKFVSTAGRSEILGGVRAGSSFVRSRARGIREPRPVTSKMDRRPRPNLNRYIKIIRIHRIHPSPSPV